MISIRVDGRGIIPRLGTIAPRKQPFKADLSMLATIIASPGLIAIAIDPVTKQETTLNSGNYRKIYNRLVSKSEKQAILEEVEVEASPAPPPATQPPAQPPAQQSAPATPPANESNESTEVTPPVTPAPPAEENKEKERPGRPPIPTMKPKFKEE